jgi:hypothetical protein
MLVGGLLISRRSTESNLRLFTRSAVILALIRIWQPLHGRVSKTRP